MAVENFSYSEGAGMLTASVVLYKTPREQTQSLLESVLSSCIERLFIIDNSPDDSRRILGDASPKIRYIHNENLGYGASHNLAIRETIDSGAEFHIVLNPDVSFPPETPEKLLLFMEEHPDAVSAMPKIVYPDGRPQYLCKLLPSPSDLIFRRFVPPVGFFKKWKEKKDARYCLMDSGYDTVINPPCLSGCFMFLRLSALTAHDIFFDDRFFMYFEDFDFIRRLHRVGKTLFFPGAQIVHAHAKESYRSRKMLLCHIKSAVRYFNKYGWLFDRERTEWNRRILGEIRAEVCP